MPNDAGSKGKMSFPHGVTSSKPAIRVNQGAKIAVRNSRLIHAITDATQWNSNMSCAVLGEYDPVLNMVAFPIGDAVENEVAASA